MRRIVLSLLCAIAAISAGAQTKAEAETGADTTAVEPIVGYYSQHALLTAMPEYEAAEKSLQSLKAKYDAEAKRSADDFNAKYEDFVEGEKAFAPTIRMKRQQELEELIDKNIAFRNESRKLLDSARAEAMAPVELRLKNAVERVGRERGLAFIINTDGGTLPFANPEYCIDITNLIREALR